MHRRRGELDRAHELENGLATQLTELHTDLRTQSPASPPVDPELTAMIDRVLGHQPPFNPSAHDAHHQTPAAARRVIGPVHDQRRGRGR